MMKSQKIIIILSIISIFLVGCKPKKNIADSKISNKNWEYSSALSDILKNESHYTSLIAKGNLELKKGNSSKKVTAIYKLIKDSVIQISLRAPLIGEVFNVHLTPDNITVVDRIKGQYISENYSELDFIKSFDFNFYNLQALLTNKLFAPGKKEITEESHKLFKMSKVSDSLILQTRGKQNVSYNFAIDATEHIISVLVIKKDLNSTILFDYSDFVNEENVTYPSKIGFSLSMPNHSIAMGITYSSVEFDKGNAKAEISIPKRYNKVSIKKLLESYINLK